MSDQHQAGTAPVAAVTGARGYVGRIVSRALAAADFDVIGLVRRPVQAQAIDPTIYAVNQMRICWTESTPSSTVPTTSPSHRRPTSGLST